MEVISIKLSYPLLTTTTTKIGKMNIHHLGLSFPRPLFLPLLIALTFSSMECMPNSAPFKVCGCTKVTDDPLASWTITYSSPELLTVGSLLLDLTFINDESSQMSASFWFPFFFFRWKLCCQFCITIHLASFLCIHTFDQIIKMKVQ